MDGAGDLYGTTYEGGIFGDGTIFELPEGSSTITTLASFNGVNGAGPYAGLIIDGAGDLYGTTRLGGASGDGTVFELAAGTNAVATLLTFNGANGQYPDGGLIMDSAGDLDGTTYAGGPGGFGTIFELGSRESETVSAADPSLITSAGASVIAGSGTKLTNSATLAGGFNPTGTITFSLVAPNGYTVVDSETDSVTGNGTFVTPNGYFPTASGTYQWIVSYGGDANNNPVAVEGSPLAPPLVTGPTSVTVVPNGRLTFTSGELSLSDPSATAVSDSLTLTVNHGTLALGSTNGLTFENGTANNSAVITVSGSLTELNAALSGLAYTPNLNFTGTDTLSATDVNSVDNLTERAARRSPSLSRPRLSRRHRRPASTRTASCSSAVRT